MTLDGVGADIPPALLTLSGASLLGAYSLDEVHGVVRDATVITAIGLSDCDLAALAFEAYVDVGRHHDPAADLAPLFAAGDPHVQEAVMVTIMARGRGSFARTYPYTYDGRRVHWHVPLDPSSFSENGLAVQRRVMAEGFARQADRDGPALLTAGAQLSIVGEQTCDHMVMVSFAVMAACPCGSGRTIEDCCARNN